jgi:hypothetical protein
MRTLHFLPKKIEEEQPRRHYCDENPAITGKIPEGYMTGDEFVKKGIENINAFCKKHGLL